MLLSTKARFVSAFALYLLGNLLRSVLPLSRHPFGSYLFFILLYALIGLPSREAYSPSARRWRMTRP